MNDSYRFTMKFFKKIHNILLKPEEFFTKIKKEKGIKDAFLYYSIFAVIIGFLTTIYLYRVFSTTEIYSSLIQGMMFPILIVLFIFILMTSIAGIFIISGIIHLFVLLLNGKNRFSETFKVLIYGDTPRFIFSIITVPISTLIIPVTKGVLSQKLIVMIITGIIGLAILIWSIYLKVIGIAKLQNISKFRAFAAVFLIPLGILILFYIVLIIVFVNIGLF